VKLDYVSYHNAKGNIDLRKLSNSDMKLLADSKESFKFEFEVGTVKVWQRFTYSSIIRYGAMADVLSIVTLLSLFAGLAAVAFAAGGTILMLASVVATYLFMIQTSRHYPQDTCCSAHSLSFLVAEKANGIISILGADHVLIQTEFGSRVRPGEKIEFVSTIRTNGSGIFILGFPSKNLISRTKA
jgi:hypothetical protein